MTELVLYDNNKSCEMTFYLNDEGQVIGLTVYYFSPQSISRFLKDNPDIISPQRSVTYPGITPSNYAGLRRTSPTMLSGVPPQVLTAPGVTTHVANPNQMVQRVTSTPPAGSSTRRGCC
jgi:hypothetical protein